MNRPFHFIIRNAGPGLIIQEALYGFIMALIFVVAVGVGILDVDRYTLLIMILGMNLTWGAIDMVVFYFVDEGEHRMMYRFVRDRQSAGKDTREFLRNHFDGTVLDSISDEDKERVYDIILESRPVDCKVYRSERLDLFLSAFSCFVTTALTVVPFMLCLLLIPNYDLALLCCCIMSTIIMFFLGYKLAPCMNHDNLRLGLAVALVGVLLTLIATFTGG